MKLTDGFSAVALKLQEDSTALSQRDICSRLSDALRDIGNDEGEYYYIVDIFGDDQSGDVVFSCDGNLKQASYEFSAVNGKQVAAIDMEGAIDVMPRTTYEPEADDEDHYAGMEEAFKKANLYTELPLYERFISKSERDNMSSSNFAGKGKSFPINKPGDVMAAVRSMGRAGSGNYDAGTLKRNIIRIAKKLGFTKYLPKAWQGDGGKEARKPSEHQAEEISVIESASTIDQIVLQEARSDYEIKLIAPGKGSSAFYPKEVLQRDGPQVFKAGTHVYLNHPTAAEEAARPEGDVKNLAGVLTTDASYHENHAKGPGLYARMKVFADHAQTVEEKAPHVGMSIRASGRAESNQKRDGLPVLTHLTHAESVDVVTRAGAGGMILTEAARNAENTGEENMDDTKRLIEAALQPVYSRQRRDDARAEASRLLDGITLPDAAKQRIVERVVSSIDVSKDVDAKQLRESVIAEAKAEGEYLAEVTGAGRVFGMGSGPVAESKPLSKKERKALKESKKEYKREARAIFEELGLTEVAAKHAAQGRVA